MALVFGEPGSRGGRRIALPSFSTMLSVLIALVLLGLAARILLKPVAPIIEPFSVPKRLEERGYTSTVVAQRVLDEVRAIDREAYLLKDDPSRRMLGQPKVGGDFGSSGLAAIQVPSTGLTVSGFVSVLRELMEIRDIRIGGEVTAKRTTGFALFGDTQGYSLLLRIDGPSGRLVQSFETDNLDEGIKLAARAIVRHFDPAVLVAYLRGVDPNESKVIVEEMLRSENAETFKWALVLRGVLSKDDDAPRFYEQAVSIDPSFGMAYYIWSLTLDRLKQPDQALEKLSLAIKHNPGIALPYALRGILRRERQDYPGALADFGKARELLTKDNTPEDRALIYVNLGDMLREVVGDSQDYVECYRRAASLDAQYSALYEEHRNQRTAAARTSASRKCAGPAAK